MKRLPRVNKTVMDRKSVTGLLNSLFNFKKLPDGSVDKSKVQCSICLKEFNYHLSTASLSYHLQAKHPGVAPNASQLSKTQLRQSTILECGSCCRPLDESTSKKLTTAIARWVATDCRPVNIVEDSGLRDVIRLACSDPAYTFLIWKRICIWRRHCIKLVYMALFWKFVYIPQSKL